MKTSIYVRFSLSLLLVLSLLSPVAALGMGDGKKHFKAGMKHEVAEEWDKAAEEFALAVMKSPRNPEYRLHLQRALFQASQQYMKKGATAAREKDYEGAYIAFRKAYGFDPTNELAKSEMDRMVRLQQEVRDGKNPVPVTDASGKIKLLPTGYDATKQAQDTVVPQKLEKLRDVPFPSGVDLQFLIKELARDLDLNVLFDAESRLDNRRIKIELRNVTAAKALDYIFLQENLFFQKVGPRTIIVATGNQRVKFQQLVLRTFYLANASPKDIAKIIPSAIPAQPGRSQTIVLTDDATNSVTVRDTEENIRLIGKLISSLDKDRAEVVMDVAIYEVNKNDLLQFGNQVGTAGDRGSLLNLGGIALPTTRIGSNRTRVTAGLPFRPIDFASIAIGLPISSISALQSKSDTKLIASTQIHAFNNEDSSARIGQRVPVQTAQFVTGSNPGVISGGVVSNVINYEQVGLTLKFKPIVFPNQDVQVAMEIESKDVAGANTLQPTFTERTIKGTARVQNNKTLLLASVAQGVESKGRTGLPLLGLLPIIGRLFTAPTRDNRQVDIVIAITPKVIRAPAILPEDEIERPTGSIAVPTSGSLEAMIIEEERGEMIAAARKLPRATQIQLPDQPAEAPTYVRSDSSAVTPKSAPPTTPSGTTPAFGHPSLDKEGSAAVIPPLAGGELNAKLPEVTTSLVPIDSTVKTLEIKQTADTTESLPAVVSEPPAAAVELQLAQNLGEMKAGEKIKAAVMVRNTAAFKAAVLGLKFDDKKLAVRSVSFGDVFGTTQANTSITPFLNQGGRVYVSMSAADAVLPATGVLMHIEIEALVDGKPELALDKEILSFMTADGRNLVVKF